MPSNGTRSNKPQAVKTAVIAATLEGKTISQTAKELGIAHNTVKAIQKETKVQELQTSSIESAMHKAGLTPETIAAKIAELTMAEDTRLASFEGKFTDRVDVPDNPVRHRAVELGARILNMLPKEDASASAALFVRMPIQVLADGHAPTCLCSECARVWESKTRDAITVLPELPELPG